MYRCTEYTYTMKGTRLFKCHQIKHTDEYSVGTVTLRQSGQPPHKTLSNLQGIEKVN